MTTMPEDMTGDAALDDRLSTPTPDLIGALRAVGVPVPTGPRRDCPASVDRHHQL